MELQGHRGARGELPENSLPGFEAAIAAGADCLELDIAMTRDGQLMITHDATLNPDITRKGGAWITERVPIKALTARALEAYDIGRLRPGSAYARRFPGQLPIDGLRMPRLEELFTLPDVVARPTLVLDVEIKTSPLERELTFAPEAIAEALVQLMERTGVSGRCRIRSFDWRGLVHVKKIAGDMPLAFLTARQSSFNNLAADGGQKSRWLGGIDIDDFGGSAARAVDHLGGEIWAPHFEDLTKAELDEAHRLGLKVIVWTVNEAADMRRMIEIGADGFTTDYPALGRGIIDAARDAGRGAGRGARP